MQRHNVCCKRHPNFTQFNKLLQVRPGHISHKQFFHSQKTAKMTFDAVWFPYLAQYILNNSFTFCSASGSTEWCSASLPRYQSSWGQHGAHLGPVGPRWAPFWPHESCYQGTYPFQHSHTVPHSGHSTFIEQCKLCAMDLTDHNDTLIILHHWST